MENKNIIELLFEKKDMDGKLYSDNKQLEDLDKHLCILEDKITHVVSEKVNPKYRKKINGLINDYIRTTYQYYDKERGLIYKTGFFDGMKIIVDSLHSK